MPHIVYMSRGHGYGHAAVDRTIVAALRALRQDVDIDLASYGTGLEFYRSHAIPCIDLRIDDDHDQGPEAMLRVAALLRQRRHADLVVGHEIFTVPPVCAKLGLRSVLLTHWFFSEVGMPEADALLDGPSTVMLLDAERAHLVPQRLRGRMTFTGAVAELFQVDRPFARQALGVDETEFVAILTTGAAHSDKLDYIQSVFAKVLAAWRLRDCSDGRLFILSRLDPTIDDPSVEWVPWTNQPELYYRAADVVITNATFATMCTLARNEVPTVAVTGGRNPVDRLHAEFLAGEGLLNAVEVSVSDHEMRHAIDDARHRRPRARGAPMPWASPTDIAQRLLDLALLDDSCVPGRNDA